MGAALALWASANLAQSHDPALSEFRVSGFGTVGVARVDAPDGWAYKRDISQASNTSATRADLDSRIGVQLNYAPASQFELVGQAIATRRTPLARESDAIEWAFAAYRPTADWTLRAGRLNLDAFLLSDHRGVGFAYPFARPPVDFYAQLPTSVDGADLARVWNDAGTQWRAKLFAGRTTVVGSDKDRLELSPMYGAMGSREADGLLVRASLIRFRFATSLAAARPLQDALASFSALPFPDVAREAAGFASQLDVKGAELTYLALGARYEGKDWLASGEYTRVTGHPALAFSSGYASVGRRFGPVTAFTTASFVASRTHAVATPDWGTPLAPLGAEFAQQAQVLAASAARAVNGVRAEQNTFGIGARWDVSARVALKVQWDWIRVKANGSRLWGGSPTLDAARANVGSALVDFVF